MKTHPILDNILVEKLIFSGQGLARREDGKKILISGGAIPESRVRVRVLREKSHVIEAQLMETMSPSPLEEKLPEHFQVYGGCRWLPIRYDAQLAIKAGQIREAFHSLGDRVDEGVFGDIIPSPNIYGYRNKNEFSFGQYISHREGKHELFRFGFHVPGIYDRVIDCTYCVLADDSVNALFRSVDTYARASGLTTYDPHTHAGFWRHFVVRKGHYTNEMMAIFSVNSPAGDRDIHSRMTDFAQTLQKEHPNLTSVYLLHNTGRADIVAGDYACIAGSSVIRDQLLGRMFAIGPRSFFQTNTLGAEKLYQTVLDMLPADCGVALDLYAGTGTIGILLASRCSHVYSIESVPEATEDARANAASNQVVNFTAVNGLVEKALPEVQEKLSAEGSTPSVVVVDPPRDGLHPDACEHIARIGAPMIVYVSCNPATLARDLDRILTTDPSYRITAVTPVDMFPHTHHIETVVRLVKNEQ